LKKKLSILIALVMAISLCLAPAAPIAAETPVEGMTYEIVGKYYPVDFTVTDDGPTVTWTFDMIGNKDLVGNGHWGYGLAISLDGEKPAFQIHNNDGTDSTYPWGTHLYSPYDDRWKSSDMNTLVSELDWVACKGDRDIANNADGVFTVTIDKTELGLEFYWAIWFGVGGFYNPNNGYSSYPEGFMWQEDVTAGHYEPYTIPQPPAPVRSPDAFDVFVRFGYDSTRYYPDNTLAGSIEAAGEYNGIQYMLEIPASCVIEGTVGRVNWLWLDNITDNILTFVGGDATFSKACTLYKNNGGKLYQDYQTGEWLSNGEWVEVGSFTAIVNGQAVLE